jgi:hypothetical protein
MPSMHLATDRGMNDGLNGLLLDVRLVSAASAMLEALKYADRGPNIGGQHAHPRGVYRETGRGD